MTGRRRARRRLLWGGVLLGLVLLVAAVSVLRAGLWARDKAVQVVPSRRRKHGAFAS